MPRNKKESMIFTLCMCCLMVLGMSCYNSLLHGSLTLPGLLMGFVPGFIVALLLDIFVVGGIAKKVAFSLPLDRERSWQLPLAISVCMVLGMVTCMSLFGLLMEAGLGNFGLMDYFHGWMMNFIMALPLQLILVRPFSVTVLKQVQA